MKDLYQQLENEQIGKIRLNEPLSKHTTMKIGGPADIFVEPNSIESLEKTVRLIREANVPFRVIGRGSNLLVNDEGIRGVVIKLGKGINHLEIEDEILRVGAGYPMVPLATIMSKKGYAGFEFAGGIPGSVGGAVYMNAGAHGSDISQIIIEARVLYPDGTLKWVSKEELNYSYRTSALQFDNGICVEAKFQLTKGDSEKIYADMQSFKDYRHSTQPYDMPCAGSIFRNPLPQHSGKLIEDAGLKGYKIGGAQISELHANFIVNAGGATAENVRDLIAFIKNTISDKNAIDLHTEIEIILPQESN
ncbi:UDP-N-acetylmuramate dehydrogenase [Scopulibacillus cellulosilyticus]|uniref:UDP-N-acetylenolpyruvoylglucosamine reductase n=1 Tax=Scopulibacillus cellulosilyticus TaxID=2665665 RepID=A0ABW2PST4_9BACL